MITKIINDFRGKMKSGSVIGLFSKTCDPALVEVMGYSGFDFVILDMEHGPNSIETLQNLIRAAQIVNIIPIVRTKENLFNTISEALDIGAGGVQVPQITCAADAKRAIEASRYSPKGMRGVCRFVRAADYSAMERNQYFSESNRTIVILQLEGAEAIENLDEILNVDGIDVIFIGPYDLSQSLGVPGDVEHPLVETKMIEIIEVCNRHGIMTGVFVDTIQNAMRWKNIGMQYIAYSVDMGIFYESSIELLKKLR